MRLCFHEIDMVRMREPVVRLIWITPLTRTGWVTFGDVNWGMYR